MGKLIVLEGLDGSGKATQAALLAKTLREKGFETMQVTFPDYESDSSALVRMYLAGEFGERPDSVNPYAASAFYAVDRYASYQKNWKGFYQSGGIVVADRYTTSNAVHQCAKLPETQWADYLDWLFCFEYEKMKIPAPDKVLYLDMDPAVSQRLLEGRYREKGTKDIHEKDVAYLKRARAAALYCQRRLGWSRIACDDGSLPYPIEDIARRIEQAATGSLQKEGK
ncbi:MAG: deoxynucleoside kinase [Oscillospiraceae bacterium]|nr:deoxynucleoside kinase [Oscillospiraceae bacterium]